MVNCGTSFANSFMSLVITNSDEPPRYKTLTYYERQPEKAMNNLGGLFYGSGRDEGLFCCFFFELIVSVDLLNLNLGFA